MENKFKPIKLETTENKPIVFDTQEMFNQEYINNLTRLISNSSSTPSYIPKKFTDCFTSTLNGLYVYINNNWVLVGNNELSGTSLPTASENNGKYYYLTTTDTLYRSNGTAWIALN